MEPLPALNEFMLAMFRERSVVYRKEAEVINEYRRRFYSSECSWGTLDGKIHWSESEAIVSIALSDDSAQIITSGFGELKARYHLATKADAWLIHEVDSECPGCYQGKTVKGEDGKCRFCGGTGWAFHAESRGPLSAEGRGEGDRSTVSNMQREQLDDSMSPVAYFMHRFVRARTAACIRQLELVNDYRKKFYTDACFWDSRRGVAAGSTSEKVTEIMECGSNAKVITTTTGVPSRWRYHLISIGQDWLISKVEMECSQCRLLGVTGDCPQCGGTEWIYSEKLNRRPVR